MRLLLWLLSLLENPVTPLRAIEEGSLNDPDG